MIKYFLFLLLICYLIISCGKNVSEIEEPQSCVFEGKFASIQEDIDAASDGDTVLIQPGVYEGNINFRGKNIVVGSVFLSTGDRSYISQTVINANKNGSVVRFENGESSEATLIGLTLTNGLAFEGGGIYCNSASPTLRDLIVTRNLTISCNEGDVHISAVGGGIYLYNSYATLRDVYISENKSEIFGGGIFCDSSNPDFKNVTVVGDTASDGGGIYLKNSSPKLLHVSIRNNIADRGAGLFFTHSSSRFDNTIVARNIANYEGGGIYLINSTVDLMNIVVAENTASSGGGFYLFSSSKIIMNSILWNNSPEQLYFRGNGGSNSAKISFSDVDGGESMIEVNMNGDLFWNEGNIDANPVSNYPSYWLEQPGGIPVEGSPCINAGNPAPQFNDEDGSRNDIGAHGGPN